MKVKGAILNTLQATAARGDVRHYLEGVHIVNDGVRLRLEATDGHRAARVDLPIAGGLPLFDVLVVVPRLPANAEVELFLRDDGRLAVRTGNLTAGLDVVDGRFPELDRVLPAPDGKYLPESMNAAYIEAAGKAFTAFARALDRMPKALPLKFRQQQLAGPVLVSCSRLPEVTYCIMPLRD